MTLCTRVSRLSNILNLITAGNGNETDAMGRGGNENNNSHEREL